MRGPRRSPDPTALANVAAFLALAFIGLSFVGWVTGTVIGSVALVAAASLGVGP